MWSADERHLPLVRAPLKADSCPHGQLELPDAEDLKCNPILTFPCGFK